jgi:membrane-associated phospholipid phosphatase
MLLNTLVNIWHQLEKWDQALFVKLNGEWTNPVLDAVLPFIRNSFFWAPLYLFLVVLVAVNFKSRGWWWVLFFLCTFAITDMVSSRLIKESVERLRPCNDPAMFDHVRLLLKHCGTGYSFTSSHATNHFGMAAFFFISFRKVLPKWAWVGFAWALVIVYAQVYVGVHYPVDVTCGAILGTSIGLITGRFFNKRYSLV